MVYTSFNRRVMNEDVENISTVFDNIDTSGVSDNIEEATSNLLYETEVNWNSLMQAVGIAELAAMESTGEVIYEAVDFKAFFSKVKEFFKGLLEKIGRLFKKILEKTKEIFSNIKKFFSGNKKNNTSNTNNNSTSTTDNSDNQENIDFFMSGTAKYYKGYRFTHLGGIMNQLHLENAFDNCRLIKEYKSQIDIFYRSPYGEESCNHLKEWETTYVDDSEFRNNSLTDMRSLLLGVSLDSDYDWDKEIFKYFRNNKTEPEEILIDKTDISKYQNTIKNNEKLIEKAINKSYENINKYTGRSIKFYEDTVSGYESGTFAAAKVEIKYFNTLIEWLKILLQEATNIIAAQSNAIMAQTRQYKAALTKIMQESVSLENETHENIIESSEHIDSILDNVNFI